MKVLIHLMSVTVVVLLFTATVNATQYTATASGNWSTMVWSPAGTPGATDDVVIPDLDTVTIDQNFTINNLTIGGGGTTGAVLQFSKLITDTITVNGNILIQANASFKVQTNGNTSPTGNFVHMLTLLGNLTHNGSTLDFRVGTSGSTLGVCNLILSGTTNSTLTMNTPYSSTNGDFNAVTINKTGGAKVILGSNIYVDGGSSTGPANANSVMTFVNGLIETGNYIWVCLTTTSASVLGYSSTSYVNGAMGRGISSSGAGNKDFPVGDAFGYRPFNLRSTTSGSATGHYAIVRCKYGNANAVTTTYTGGINRVSYVRYYQVSYNNTGAGAASMSFDRFGPSYGLDDGVSAGNQDLRVAYSSDNGTTWNGLTQLTHPDTTNLSSPPRTIFGDSLATPYVINAGTNSLLIALANVTGGANVLPVELTSLSASNKNNDITLNWKTTTEINNSGFEIERRIGNSEWVSVSFVKGAGTSTVSHNYSFNDRVTVSGKYTYRLKQKDFSGEVHYFISSEINVQVPQELTLFQNYPNPFNPSTVMEFSVPSNGIASLSIYNTLGEKVNELFNGAVQSGQIYKVTFDAHRLSSGIYFSVLESGGKKVMNKMILLK